MRALGFDMKKQEVVQLVEDVDIHRSGRVHLEDFLEISTALLQTDRRTFVMILHASCLP